jgi:hypothetical protein
MRMKCEEMKAHTEKVKNELNDAKKEQDILCQFALIRRLSKGKCLCLILTD